jgi:hypothetical protein
MASRLANAIDTQEKIAAADPLIKLNLGQKSKRTKNLILHYTHEARLERYQRDIHQLWHQTFTDTSVLTTNLIIGHRNNRNFRQMMINRHQHHSKLS